MRSTPVSHFASVPQGHSSQSSESPPAAVLLGQGGSDQGSGGFQSKYSSFDLILVRLVSKAPLRNTFWKGALDHVDSNPSQTSRVRGKERNCEIIEVAGCGSRKPLPVTSHRPELLLLPLTLRLSPPCTSGSAGTSAGNGLQLFLCPWDPAAYDHTLMFRSCPSTHSPGAVFESSS